MAVINKNIRNERLKRDFLEYLEQAKGHSPSTIDKNLRAINEYEKFSNNSDFGTYSKNKAIEYKKYLLNGRGKEAYLSPRSQYDYLRALGIFFIWLSGQPGYKNKINFNSILFLNLDKKTNAIATQPKSNKYPDLEYCKKIVSSIPIKTCVDLRDRALISFLFCTGIRHSALTSIPIGCIDLENFIIYQDPQIGVKTKFTKYITSKIFEFDIEMIESIKVWSYKQSEMGFSIFDPFFPRSKMERQDNSLLFQKPTEVEPIFWKSHTPICKILKERTKQANLAYYPPHQFRHGCSKHVLKFAKNAEQMKAVSQHFGHEFVATTFKEYGNYSETELIGILKSIDFKDEPKISPNDIVKFIQKLPSNEKFIQFFKSVISE